MGTATAIVAVEGVLADQASGPFAASRPIDNGVKLVRSLEQMGFRIVFLAEGEQLAIVQNWLQVNLMLLQTPQVVVDMSAAETITWVRSVGYDLTYYIDANPEVCAEAIRSGVTTLVFANPSYARPEFLPDAKRTIKPWSVLEQEIIAQKERHAKDGRRSDQRERRFAD